MEPTTRAPTLQERAHVCPLCGGDTEVTSSPLPKRYRRCLTCRRSYTTQELYQLTIDTYVEASREALKIAADIDRNKELLDEYCRRLQLTLYGSEEPEHEPAISR